MARCKRGRFVKETHIKWINNVTLANKRRKLERNAYMSGDSARRVVELNQLAKDLWCSACDRPLSLRNVASENINGLASSLGVKCDECLVVHRVNTCKKSDTANGRPMYDVNKKFALGMLDCGMGPTRLNTLLSAAGLPAMSESLLKRHERKVGVVLEQVARDSCIQAIKLEKQLTKQHVSQTDLTPDKAPAYTSTPHAVNYVSGHHSLTTHGEPLPSPIVTTPSSHCAFRNGFTDNMVCNSEERLLRSPPTRLKASYDAGWQKRGNQKSYNSRTGHASAIGYYSKKLVGYAVRKTSCRACTRGVPKTKHDCGKNFSSSAKAMEADMALELLAKNPNLESENCVVGVVIGDDDSSTIAAVRRSVSHHVEKWSDLNHATKGVSNALYALKGKNKLPTHVIKYLTRCFGYAIKQNRNDPDKVRDAIMVSVDHAFDLHAKCGTWCSYSLDPTSYKHKGLPNGKGLQGDELYGLLVNIFKRYANNAERLAPCGSSQANESFNSVAIRKHAKADYYGDSESIDFRIASAVCQKNEGTCYVMDVNERVGLSPGNQTKKYRQLKDRKRAKDAGRKLSLTFKRKRQLLKGNHASKTSSNEEREGISYESECSVPGMETLVNNPHEDLSNVDCAFVVFDLETSGFGAKAEICQVAAICGPHEFNRYIVPSKGIPHKVTEVTGLTAQGGDLYLRGERVETTSPSKAMKDFITFLKSISQKVILVAHNCFSFDAKQLTAEVKRLRVLQEFCTVVVGFSDTLPIFKQKLVERKQAKGKFTQVELAKAFDIQVVNAHNATSDVKVLAQLIKKLNVTEADLRNNKKPLYVFANADQIKAERESFLSAIGSAASKGMASRMYDAGICLETLKVV